MVIGNCSCHWSQTFKNSGNIWTANLEQKDSKVPPLMYSSAVCLPMVYDFKAILDNSTQKTAYTWFCVGMFCVLEALILSAAASFICILIKIKRAASLRLQFSSTPTQGLGLKLAIIAFVTAACWVAVIPLAIFEPFYALIVISFVAISNPLVFTLFSRQFYDSAEKFCIKLRFKCGKAASLAEMSNDDDEPLLTNLPTDSTTDLSSGEEEA
eukprot:m.25079 g.25079  ORF g.25079 m.25079 type:complete len:212 (+) comp28732_c0_seq1:559-1194(+)